MFWQPLSTDDATEVGNMARRVREKTPNLHAVYHQADGDTAASLQQVDVWSFGAAILMSDLYGVTIRDRKDLAKLITHKLHCYSHVQPKLSVILKNKLYFSFWQWLDNHSAYSEVCVHTLILNRVSRTVLTDGFYKHAHCCAHCMYEHLFKV